MIACLPRVRFASLIVVGAFVFCSCTDQPADSPPLKLWYDRPAEKWTDALPLGNGSFGVMVYGRPVDELIKLNHDTFWRGGPSDWNNPDAPKYIQQVSEALEANDHLAADSLIRFMQGKDTEPYQPLADLYFRFDSGEITRYYRELDIQQAVHTVRFERDGIPFSRQMFSSYPDSVMAIQLQAGADGKLNFEVGFTSIVLHESRSEASGTAGTVKIRCKTWNDPDWDREGMEAEVWLKVISDGGRVTSLDSSVRVDGANGALLLLTCGTSFNGRFSGV